MQRTSEVSKIDNSSEKLKLAATNVVCTSFQEVCSENNPEVRNQTIVVSQAGTYSMVLAYRAFEKTVNGLIRIDGVVQNVTFPQVSTYQNQTNGSVTLSAGSHTIGLSSGSTGGMICFNSICLTDVNSSTTNCGYTVTGSSNNANER